MAYTDTDILTQLDYHLIETVDAGATVSSGLWTVQEWIDALNNAQQWVLIEGRPFFNRTTLNTVANNLRFQLPQDWLITQRVSWHSADGTYKELGRDSSWSPDYLQGDWTYNLSQKPEVYTDFDPPQLQIQVMPPASDNGVLDITYVALPPALSNTGVEWVIPSCTVPMAKWKALAILLAKDGRGQDLPRANTALSRANEGMTALKVLLKGWS